jgi:hypothetical protein
MSEAIFDRLKIKNSSFSVSTAERSPTHIPNVQDVISVVERFDIEAERWSNRIDFFSIDPRKDGRFAGIIKSNQQETHFFLLAT